MFLIFYLNVDLHLQPNIYQIMKKSFLLSVFIISSLFLQVNFAQNNGMVGWATVYNNGQGVTGGGTFNLNAPNAVIVRNETEFYNAIGKNDATPKIIILDGIINRARSSDFMLQGLKNKTIFGLPGARIITANSDIYGFLFRDCENIIVRNITFEGKGSTTNQKGDMICTENTVGVWIDHCTFIDGGDGNVDITKGSDLVSVTYCKFYYTALSGHTYACLIGSSDSSADLDDGKLRCTFQYVWWADGCVERMPRVRFGKVHVVNNLYDSQDAQYCVRAGYASNIYIENNSFLQVKQPVAGQFEDYDPESPYWVTFVNNLTVGTQLGDTQSKIENDLFGVWKGHSWIPANEPNYKMNNSIVSAALSEKIVRAEAGPTLKMNADGTVAEAARLFIAVENSNQQLIQGKAISNIVFTASIDGAELVVDGVLPAGLSQSVQGKQLIISGTPQSNGTIVVRVKGSCTVDGNLLLAEETATIIVSDINKIEISDVKIGGVPVILKADSGVVQFARNADISKLKVEFKIPESIQSDFISGNAHDFSQSPLVVKLTAPDQSSALFTFSVVKDTKHKVLYLIQASKYSHTTTDKIYNLFSTKYDMERRDADASVRDMTYYKDFDLVFMQESLEGRSCAGSHELYQLHTAVDLPVLSTKSFFYSSGRLGWGTPLQAGSNKDVTIQENYRNHPVFKDVTLTDGKLAGMTSQPVTINSAYAGTMLGEADNASGGRGTTIHELSADQRFGAGNDKKSGYLLISLMNADFPNISDNVLKVYENAAEYLLNPGISSGISEISSTTFRFDGRRIYNTSGEIIRLYNVSGALVTATNQDVEMSTMNRGIYFIRTSGGAVMKLIW